MKSIYFLLFACFTGLCKAQSEPTPSASERFRAAFERAAKHAGAIKDYGAPRLVNKGAKPALILSEGKVYFNGSLLTFGEPLEKWEKVLGGQSVCSKRNEKPRRCKWDALGIEIGSTFVKPASVEELVIRLGRDPDESLMTSIPAKAGESSPDTVLLSKGTFQGYLEMDRFGIDSKTKFWEIRTSVAPDHNLRCGLRECHQPHGKFSDEVNIAMILSSGDENGTLRELSLYRP
ncbi:hypothetical protein IP91_00266 [Pseudoduganella lurida]|uniref:DUF7738 domain-containing protein n=1 Tax=Pseudoduganella lurida TaxID=1036180 RepID=A0A562RLA3_9BURK|nr:hypothetical protein [Pseudoduganella lurida]TWI69200.1 hypothetical protein IP91_00266 [Pseudoduganella lurida]